MRNQRQQPTWQRSLGVHSHHSHGHPSPSPISDVLAQPVSWAPPKPAESWMQTETQIKVWVCIHITHMGTWAQAQYCKWLSTTGPHLNLCKSWIQTETQINPWKGREKCSRGTNLLNQGLISADRNNKATLLLTIPSSVFKSSAKDLARPIFEIIILQSSV